MIQLHPSKFGKLEDLLHLVSSKDRRIREMVVFKYGNNSKNVVLPYIGSPLKKVVFVNHQRLDEEWLFELLLVEM